MKYVNDFSQKIISRSDQARRKGEANEATALGPAPSRAPHHVKKSLNIPFIFILSPYNGCKNFNQLLIGVVI